MSQGTPTYNPVFPSILSTNFFNLQDKLNEFEKNKIDFIHLDVMDGHFVDNISFGPSASKSIKSQFNFKIDAHLMVSNPGKMIPKFIDAGSDWVSFHIETTENINTNINAITSRGCKAGLVLNPDTPVEKVFPYLEAIDYVLLMSVFPGFGGQKFIEATLERTAGLKEKIQQAGTDCLIQVDGGLNNDNIPRLVAAGCDLFVIGTFLFNSDNIKDKLQSIINNIKGA
ncbi:MAG: ribulose-phosphate 3-epimerase [bacterium]|nr:ribulose-phosphate 3-epimerase [bacterium]